MIELQKALLQNYFESNECELERVNDLLQETWKLTWQAQYDNSDHVVPSRKLIGDIKSQMGRSVENLETQKTVLEVFAKSEYVLAELCADWLNLKLDIMGMSLKNLVEGDLQYVETTGGSNGYPHNLGGAIIGFDNPEQLRKFASDCELMTIELHKRDGWQLWEREDYNVDCIVPRSEWYGDDYDIFQNTPDTIECLEGLIHDLKDDEERYGENNAERIAREQNLLEEVKNLKPNEAAVAYCMGYYDTIQYPSVEWGYDTHTYAIGVC